MSKKTSTFIEVFNHFTPLFDRKQRGSPRCFLIVLLGSVPLYAELPFVHCPLVHYLTSCPCKLYIVSLYIK